MAGGVAAVRLPRPGADLRRRDKAAAGVAPDGRPLYGPAPPGDPGPRRLATPAVDAAAGPEGTVAPGPGPVSPLSPATTAGAAPGGGPPGDRRPAAAAGDPRAARQVRIDVARERQQLGLPLYVPDVVLGLAAMSVIRGAVGFLTFFLAFTFRHLDVATWWFGFVLLTSAIGSLLGSVSVPSLRRYLSEQQLILYSLVLCAVAGIATAISGSIWVQPILTFAIGFASTAAKPSFDSIVQRQVPPALLGRAFARFETRLQLVWVLCALVAVVIQFPTLQAGDALIGAACTVAALFHISMRRSVARERTASRRARRQGPARSAGGAVR